MRIILVIVALCILGLPSPIRAAPPCPVAQSGRGSGTLVIAARLYRGQTATAQIRRLPFGFNPPDYVYIYFDGALAAQGGAIIPGTTGQARYMPTRAGRLRVVYSGVPAFLWSFAVACA